MSGRKTTEEKLSEINIKLNQLKAQKQALLKKENERLRKQRTRKLIQFGALIEKYFNCEDLTPEEFEIFLKELISKDVVKDFIAKRNK